MLRFSAEHGVRPMVEVVPAAMLNEAVARVASNEACYRVALDMGASDTTTAAEDTAANTDTAAAAAAAAAADRGAVHGGFCELRAMRSLDGTYAWAAYSAHRNVRHELAQNHRFRPLPAVWTENFARVEYIMGMSWAVQLWVIFERV
jgi:hypothetical protein